MVDAVRSVWLSALVVYCSAVQYTTIQGLSCADGKFRYNTECLDCHCPSTCDTCDTQSGCTVCNNQRVCAIGYTDFPACQIVLETPDVNTITWASLKLETVVFYILTQPSNEDEISGAQYDIECISAVNEVKTANIIASSRASVSITDIYRDYVCTATLSLGIDKSETGPSFTVSPCTGWDTAKTSMSVSTRIQIDVPHHLLLDVYVPDVTFCSSFPPTFEYNVSTSGELVRQKYASTRADLLAIEDVDMKLELNTPYTSLLQAYDGDTHLGDVSLPFTTASLVQPKVSTSSSEIIQRPGIVEMRFSVWSDVSDEGNVSPDGYKVEYRMVNTSYPIGWSSEDAFIIADKVHVSLPISHPGQPYEYRIVTSVSVYGEVYDTPSNDTQQVTTLPCQAPSSFDLYSYSFLGGDSSVILQLYYTEPTRTNCGDKLVYKAMITNSQGTEEEACGSTTSCQIQSLEANTNYNITLLAYNQANLFSQATTSDGTGILSVLTPKKAPDVPANVSYSLSGMKVTVTWNPPEKNNGKVTNYYVSVKETETGNTVQDVTDLGLQQTFSFTGYWNKEYNAKVRARNDVGDGLEETISVMIPPTKAGMPRQFNASTLNTSCILLEWSAPEFDGGVIDSYVGVCSFVNGYSNKSVVKHTKQHDMPIDEYRDLTEEICELIPGSQYNCSVAASNSAGLGARAVQLAWTEPNKPKAPPQPEVLSEKSTDSTITLHLPEANVNDLPASAYFVGMEALADSKLHVLANIALLTKNDFTEYKAKSSHKYITAKLDTVDREFVVGDDGVYGGYLNAPLTKNQTYAIYYGVEVTRGSITKVTFTQLNISVTVNKYIDKMMEKQIIIGVVSAVATLILALAIAAVLFLVIGKRGGRFSRRPTLRAELIPLRRRRAMNQKSPDSDSANGEVMEPGPISVHHLKSYIATEQDQIAAQYKALPTGFLSPCTAATDPENKERNRFANILPYDHSRVVLSVTPGVHSSDYINANYINGYNKKKKYIAASGPKDSTCADFWRMIWQHQVTCIVMVTKCVEEGKLKCQKYWPDARETQRFDDLEVTNTSIENWADFTMTTVSIRKPDGSKTLTCHHFLFLSWPDHGVPRNSTPFLLFRRKVMDFYSGQIAPLVVHCSAGVGRTGTFMAIDYLLEQAQAEEEVDAFHVVQSLRNQRVTMVQTVDQYRYIYQAVCEALATQDFHYSAAQFQDSFLSWSEQDIIGRQFESLAEITSQANSNDFYTGSEKCNKAKNQNPAIIPHDQHRAHIISQPSGHSSTYINAVFVSSYRRKDSFIATQMPLPTTVDDYLRLMYDHEVHSVVALEGDPFSNKLFGVYLPDDITTPLETELFTVTMTTVNDLRADIVIADLTLTYKHARGKASHSLRYFQVNFWPQDQPLPEDRAAFITLLEQVEKCHLLSKGYSSICVQCRDGNERTSVFLAVWNALERLKTEQEVDVYHTIELIRLIRPQAVTNVAQYQFIYDMLYTYLQEFDLYANYK